jgi:glucose-6-phosphate 1-dehydrogenase
MVKKFNVHHIDRDLPPTILTIFGATGDLAADYLLPALLHMHTEKLLPKDFHLVCVGRRDFTTKAYLDFIVKKSSVLKKLSPKQKSSFLKILTYYKGDFDDIKSFEPLAKMLADQEKPKHHCYNRLFYFATSPQLFATITHILQQSGLLMSCSVHNRQARVLVEKPFGFNLASAKALNKLLLKYFSEDQIYRIDHYQGKETVQNLMVVRFANSIFEPLWNNKYIDHIEISVLEKDTAKSRAEYYDQSGALKDMVQNHILQILGLVTMDQPLDFTAQYIRDQKLKVLESLVPVSPQSAKSDVALAQYQGYTKDVGHETTTETYAAIKAFINTPRWKGVPIYLRTGKALSEKVAEVSVHFKELDRCIFRNCAGNVLTFRLQPDESVHLQLNNKVPGFGMDLHQGDYAFGYDEAFMSEIPSAYERLLLDFMEGDQRLFIRSDEIEAAWKFIDSIEEAKKNLPIFKYKPGTNGPAEADEMIKKDGREWWTK